MRAYGADRRSACYERIAANLGACGIANSCGHTVGRDDRANLYANQCAYACLASCGSATRLQQPGGLDTPDDRRPFLQSRFA